MYWRVFGELLKIMRQSASDRGRDSAVPTGTKKSLVESATPQDLADDCDDRMQKKTENVAHGAECYQTEQTQEFRALGELAKHRTLESVFRVHPKLG
jgi:hypothetical protein